MASDVVGQLRAGLERVAFWLAVVLPLVSVTYLLFGGLADGGAVLAGLLSANLLALVVGHRHDPDGTTADSGAPEARTDG